mmetsp:Transcript_20508/g.30352  ORF Transcript_20508/g.30352 Transcript_20508/m.30352 type:complete len:104 (-) Transcript_20508:91-402(-)
MAQSINVSEKINNTPVIVFSKTYCPYCTKAKNALNAINAHYEVIELDKVSNGSSIQSEVSRISGVRTVPQVFVGGKFIGGGDDTAKLHKSGELSRLVTAASVK